MLIALVAGQEQDRRVTRTLARANQFRGLEAVHFRHLHVQQDRGKVVFQQERSASMPEFARTSSCPSPSSAASNDTRFSGVSSTSRIFTRSGAVCSLGCSLGGVIA